MPPRIVVLCDGTWAGRETGTQTNIYRLARLFHVPINNLNSTDEYILPADPTVPSARQVVARYRHGVGLGGSFLDYLFNGATASDLAEEVILAYRFIVDNYTADHEIWMFGFSRGAYTVRSVAGLINNYGIVDRRRLQLTDAETDQMCRQAYYLYKSDRPENAPHGTASVAFRLRNSWPLIGDPVAPGQAPPRPPVRFMGLFDTVGSLGIPDFTGGLGLNYPEFYDDVVSSVVQHVCHLVSVHDRLWAFQPCLVQRKGGGAGGVHEEWLPGCHYDLGRQRFRFWRSGGGLLERVAGLLSYIPFVGHGKTIQPNLVLSDLALRKMLEQIQRSDAGNVLLPRPPLQVLADDDSAIGNPPRPAGEYDLGDGDVYGSIIHYGPFGSLAGSLATRVLGGLAVWKVLFALRDRAIPARTATVYRYGRVDPTLPPPQILDRIGNITGGTVRRYPSMTAESWALWTGQPWP
ncbi:hypothetical protein GE09DRAFT_300294 [Coniochaeta sp. 2T2.1]|nr:hypothetical protein GE09DRAFT_300294 [Coniochaeta sp. 2T2.1]